MIDQLFFKRTSLYSQTSDPLDRCATVKCAKVTALSYTTLVLWGQGFDEIAASIFVAELRRLGRRVKLVGLNSRNSAGQHGLTLVPDLPLGQVSRAATHLQCVIIPAPLAALQQFSYDPRLAELSGLAAEHQAFIVINGAPLEIHPTAQHSFTNPSLPPFSQLQQIPYPPSDELLPFVQSILAPRLSIEP